MRLKRGENVRAVMVVAALISAREVSKVVKKGMGRGLGS